MSTFQNDLFKEGILAEFLDAKYKEQLKWSTFRIVDKDLQKLGIDLIVHQNHVGKRIDEKAQLSYINTSLPTFALEIDYFIGPHQKTGWLFDEDKWTDIYAFVFSIQVNNNLKILKKHEDIVSCEVVFVRRLKLINELAKLDLTIKTCGEISRKLRTGTATKVHHPSGFNFHLSRQLSEQPVNLIVAKSFLAAIGEKYIFEA